MGADPMQLAVTGTSAVEIRRTDIATSRVTHEADSEVAHAGGDASPATSTADQEA